MIELNPSAFACDVCGAVYPSSERAAECEAFPVESEAIEPETLVRVRDASAHTGPGFVTASFLLGLDDPRGPAHTRYYRASFIWGRADFRVSELDVAGPATREQWRAAVEREAEGAR